MLSRGKKKSIQAWKLHSKYVPIQTERETVKGESPISKAHDWRLNAQNDHTLEEKASAP